MHIQKKFVAIICSNLLRKLPEDSNELKEIILSEIKAQFSDRPPVDVIPLFAETSQSAAELIMDTIIQKMEEGQNPLSKIRLMREWIQICANNWELNEDLLGKAFKVMIDMNFGDKRSERQKQEDTLAWAVALNRDSRNMIPLENEEIQTILGNYAKSKSKKVQFLLQTLKKIPSIREKVLNNVIKKEEDENISDNEDDN